MTAIIILNWNGWQDTIDCLESLQRCNGDFCVVIADNGSSDISREKLEDYIGGTPMNYPCELVCLEENFGFARGNNEAIRRMHNRQSIDHFLLLNNDTLVEKDFLTNIESFASAHPVYKVLSPLICYYDTPDKIWNAGGWLGFGFRKYYYADQSVKRVKQQDESINVSFLTGCALWVDACLLDETKGVFTERFFFGEEDFDFCLRMKRQGVKMACVLTSKIYHKVNGSTKSVSTVGKVYVHYLNRFIDMRLHLPGILYGVWKSITIFYTIVLLKRSGWPIKKSFSLLHQIAQEASQKTGVSKEDFLSKIQLR